MSARSDFIRNAIVCCLALYFLNAFYSTFKLTAIPFAHEPGPDSTSPAIELNDVISLNFTLLRQSPRTHEIEALALGSLSASVANNSMLEGTDAIRKSRSDSWLKWADTKEEQLLRLHIPPRFRSNETLYLRVSLGCAAKNVHMHKDLILTSITEPEWLGPGKRLLLRDPWGEGRRRRIQMLKESGFTDSKVLGVPKAIEVGLVMAFQPFNTSVTPAQSPARALVKLTENGTYIFPPYVNEFISPRDEYQPLLSPPEKLEGVPPGSNNEDLEILVYYKNIGPRHWMFQQLMRGSFDNLEKMGFGTYDIDSMKMMMTGTSPWLLLVTFAVSALHLIFETLALAHDFDYWRNQTDLRGLSINAFLLEVLSSIIILLYLRSEGDSVVVQIFLVARILLDVWKINKLVSVNLVSRWPFLVVKRRVDGNTGQSKESSKQKEINNDCEAFENRCMKVLCLALIGPIAGVCIYQLVLVPQKGWYSWLVTSLAICSYVGGFITMTPQVVRNYRLRSVAHMPWTVLTYQALNTFIDDLFSLLIRMPQMHKMSVLRDDVIWVIYQVQRFMYERQPSEEAADEPTKPKEEKKKD